jgi:hypothetical protein
VRAVKVEIKREMLTENAFGYGELEGRMIFAELEIEFQGETAQARLEYDPDADYPMMRLL